MITRATKWLDLKSGQPKFGIEVRVHGRWMGLAEDGKPCIFDTAAERDAKRTSIRKIKSADFVGTIVKARSA